MLYRWFTKKRHWPFTGPFGQIIYYGYVKRNLKGVK